uniref:IS30 family transposase n=1 Tax=Prevotella sp. GTC17254 TaxID=3236794 RepID=A0AB33IZM1_9BACT
MGISESTLSRELRRNSGGSGNYIWFKAHQKAMERRRRTTSNARLSPELVWRIREYILEEQWSPRQIAGVLSREGIHVSHQSIYNLIHADTTGMLAANTRHKLKYRRRPRLGAFPIANRTSIHQRPKEADGKRFGDFEMDLIVDSCNHAILTMTERSTNMLFMTRLKEGKKAKPLAREVRRLLLPYKKYMHTITTDNGPEFADHLQITKDLGVTVYFAAPYASWQKGAIENTNKLIRQYIPKSANFDEFTDKKIRMIQKKINRRPREKLGFKTPIEEFYKRIK